MSDYLFGSADLLDEQRQAMQRCLDATTIAHLRRVGAGPGWRCLEVGAGGGSIATWLADCVGPTGHVLATDLDCSALRGTGQLEVRQHDIVADELPEAEFDLVHARLVLLHLPERRRALARMVRALRPGGHLLLGEFDCTWMPTLATTDPGDAALFDRFHQGLCALLERAGADLRWGVHAYQAMLDHGLVDVDSHTSAEPWRGGGPGCGWLHVNACQLGADLAATGLLTGSELDRLRELLRDPGLVVSSYLGITISGRRPWEADELGRTTTEWTEPASSTGPPASPCSTSTGSPG